jgi:CMP-N-acetylneuraminic acid synthetase
MNRGTQTVQQYYLENMAIYLKKSDRQLNADLPVMTQKQVNKSPTKKVQTL